MVAEAAADEISVLECAKFISVIITIAVDIEAFVNVTINLIANVIALARSFAVNFAEISVAAEFMRPDFACFFEFNTEAKIGGICVTRCARATRRRLINR